MNKVFDLSSDISKYYDKGNIVIDGFLNISGGLHIDSNCNIGEYCDISSDICLNKLSQKLKIHIERLSVVSIHNNEEVQLKPNEFLIDLNTYEKILSPNKKYTRCAVIEDSIQENIIQYNESLNKNLNNQTDHIFIFDDIITNEQCDHIVETMESYFKKKEYSIEKWETNQNVNCVYKRDINELDKLVFDIVHKVVEKLRNNDIVCNGDSGYCYRKIYGPTRMHKDGVMGDKKISINTIRNMSVIICLNEHYEGGEFYFPQQDRKIKLKKGNIIAFPPYWTHPHMTYPLLNNTYRYTINTWLYE